MLSSVTLHPATRLGIWLVFAIAVYYLSPLMLAISTLVLLLLLVTTRAKNFLHLLRRMRWIFISLFVIYGYATPGVALMPELDIYSPTFSGLRAGFIHAWRLVCMLAALSVVLVLSPKEQLLEGIHFLTRPIKWLGINADSLTIRLWLTLSYAEQQTRIKTTLAEKLRSAFDSPAVATSNIEITMHPFTMLDKGILVALFAFVMLLL